MPDWLAAEPAIRLGAFGGVLLTMMIAEALLPRRKLHHLRRQRWPSNLALVVINTLAARLVSPLSAVAAGLWAEESGFGLLQLVALPAWLCVTLAVLALDLVIYGQHVMMHQVPLLWRLHRVHHADLDFDVTTGVRFHTLEIVLSLGIKLAAVVLLGAPALAVLIFEVVLNATSMFSHSNLSLPLGIDKGLRCLLVTPDMHRVHHSVILQETNSNYGFNVPWWDWLFRTYRAQPAAGHEGMTIGLSEFPSAPDATRLDRLILLPLSPLTRENPASSTDP
jgi:sterol desaturase/sphingolipid hydroxylase (fatty acid hydroxylase superfamily)